MYTFAEPGWTVNPHTVKRLIRVMAIPVAIVILIFGPRILSSGLSDYEPRAANLNFVTQGLNASQVPSQGQALPVTDNQTSEDLQDWSVYRSLALPFTLRYPPDWTLDGVVIATAETERAQEVFFIVNPAYMSLFGKPPLEGTSPGAIKIDFVYIAADQPSNPLAGNPITITDSFQANVGGLPADVLVWQDEDNQAAGFAMRIKLEDGAAIYCGAWLGLPGDTSELAPAWSTCESIRVEQFR